MRISNNFKNTSFNGYKNVISTDVKNERCRLMFLSAQLNDEGQKDLSTFREIKKLMGYSDKEINDKTLTLMYTYNPLKEELLILEDKPLYFAEELKDLKKKISPAEYAKEEQWILKAYTLVANLTNRMMHNGLVEKDIEITSAIRSTFQKFIKIMGSDQQAFELINYALFKNEPCNKTAYKFNKGVTNTMKKFFK